MRWWKVTLASPKKQEKKASHFITRASNYNQINILFDIISIDENLGLQIASFAKIKNTWCNYKFKLCSIKLHNILLWLFQMYQIMYLAKHGQTNANKQNQNN